MLQALVLLLADLAGGDVGPQFDHVGQMLHPQHRVGLGGQRVPLAGQAQFKKCLIKIAKPKERHPECYPTKFGTEGNVRIKKSLGNKVYLWQEDKVLRKIIAAFGVDVSKFMFVV